MITKLIITKNTSFIANDGHFVYTFDWYDSDELVLSEKRHIQRNVFLEPIADDINPDDLKQHKIDSGYMFADEFLVEERIK